MDCGWPLALDPAGGLWIATWPGGLSYLAPDARGFTHLRLDSEQQPDAKLNDVRAMRFSPDGWVSTSTEDLMRWTREMTHVQTYTHRAEDTHSLPSNAVNTVMEDRNGTLWVGSFTNGVARANLGNYGLDRIIPRDVAPESFPSSNFVRSIAAAEQGRLWLGVDDGLLLFDPVAKRVLQRYTANAKTGGLNHNSVYSLYLQPDNGPLWIGTPKGLNRLDRPGGKLTSIRFDIPSDNFVNAIAPGRGGMLWLGTGASLMRYGPASGAMRRYFHVENQADSRAISEAGAVQAAELADRIRASIQALAIPHAHAPLGCITVSVGVASIIPGDRQTAETLLRAADQALCRAKEAGRNCVVPSQLGRSRIPMNIADAL
jgi:ligand-binding sensor domain-containing protein